MFSPRLPATADVARVDVANSTDNDNKEQRRKVETDRSVAGRRYSVGERDGEKRP